MQLDQIILTAFLGLTSALLTFAVSFLRSISKSITKLNNQVSVLLERSHWHGTAIENLDARITKIEGSRPKGKKNESISVG